MVGYELPMGPDELAELGLAKLSCVIDDMLSTFSTLPVGETDWRDWPATIPSELLDMNDGASAPRLRMAVHKNGGDKEKEQD